MLVIGAGVGGLTTALCLHAKGFEIEVYESAREIKAPGVVLTCCRMRCV